MPSPQCSAGSIKGRRRTALIASFAVLVLSLVSTGSSPASADGPFNTAGFDTGFETVSNTSIAMNADTGLPVIAYEDTVATALKLKVCSDPSCAGSDPVVIDVDSVVRYPSLELTATNVPVIAYYDEGSGDLKIAVCAEVTCASPPPIPVTVDSGGGLDVGAFPSLELDTSGFPVISYYDATNGDLKVAACNSASCVVPSPIVNTVDVGSDGGDNAVGLFSSLALNSDLPVISYYDDTTGDVVVTACTDAACNVTPTAFVPVASGPGVTSTSLALDGGNPVIAFGGFSGLKAVICTDAACDEPPAVYDLDSTNTDSASLALNNSGYPVISYQDTENDDLKLVVCHDTGCGTPELPYHTVTTVDSSGTNGLFTSLAIDQAGNPVISYGDASGSQYKVAWIPTTSMTVDVYAGAETAGAPLLPVDPQGTGPAAAAKLGWPTNMAFGVDGDLYFTDRFNHTVRRVGADGSQVFYVAGQPGVRCAEPTSDCGDGGLAVDAYLRSPWGIALDDADPQNIYVSDYGDQKIRRIDGDDGTISTIAGTGIAGYNEDGIPAIVAMLNFPSGLTVDAEGSVLVADRGNHRIRKIPMSGVEPGVITTFLGTGDAGDSVVSCTATGDGACLLFEPTDIKVRGSSDIPSVPSTTDFFIAERANDTVLVTRTGGVDGVIADRIVSGEPPGFTPLSPLLLDQPMSLAYDALHEQLYIADSLNMRIQKYSLVNLTFTTVAGTGEGKHGAGDYVPPIDEGALDNPINFPIGLAFLPSGGQSQGTAFYIGVYENQIRRLNISENGIT